MIGAPIIWVFLTPVFGSSSDAVLYALALAIMLAMAGYADTMFLFRQWKR
jgi:hypothetical protein